MLNMLRRIFLNRHRLLFRFWDGRRIRRVDPVVVMRELMNSEHFSLEDDLKLLEVPDTRLVLRKTGEISLGVREAFDLLDLEDGGLTERECVGLCRLFLQYLGHVKKNGGSTQIASPPTEPLTTEPASAGVSDTNENSD